jgi:hypothetical protein
VRRSQRGVFLDEARGVRSKAASRPCRRTTPADMGRMLWPGAASVTNRGLPTPGFPRDQNQPTIARHDVLPRRHTPLRPTSVCAEHQYPMLSAHRTSGSTRSRTRCCRSRRRAHRTLTTQGDGASTARRQIAESDGAALTGGCAQIDVPPSPLKSGEERCSRSTSPRMRGGTRWRSAQAHPVWTT